MRLHLALTKNTELVPFNYQPYLVGSLHKWIGKNTLHDETSLYSFSWLKNGKATKNGINFFQGGNWFVSCYDTDLVRKIISGIQEDPNINFGLRVREITIEPEPTFSQKKTFKLASPVFIKRNSKFYFYTDQEATTYLTETLQTKLRKAGLPTEGVSVNFDQTYPAPSLKAINYNGILNKASLCPVVVEGSAEQIAFAWNVGVGNSTGIGFGALI